MLRILNCVTDDKFIDDIIISLDATSDRCSHEFAIVREDESTEFKYIKQKDRVAIINPSRFIPYINSEQIDAVIIHGLRQSILNLLPYIDNHIIIIWKAWGFDIYTYPHIFEPFIKLVLYKPLTKRITKKTILNRIREVHGYINYLQHRKFIQKAISRIDLFSGVLQCEYDMMSNLTYFNAGRIFYPYISLSSTKSYEKYFSPGPNILIGNSSDPSNNHLEIFEVLKKINIGKKNIYCPLNYGGTKEYRNYIIETGKRYWGDAFIPLLTFLPQKEFFDIIKSCSIAIFNHERQQALGNISLALLNGCSVYLSSTSINYKELSGLGYKLFDITKDLPYLKTLSESEIQNNQILAKKLLSKEAFLEHVDCMYDKIESLKHRHSKEHML